MAQPAKADQQQWVRDKLPTCVAVASQFKAVFGDVRLVHAAENGHELGQRSPDGVRLSETVVGSFAKPKGARL